VRLTNGFTWTLVDADADPIEPVQVILNVELPVARGVKVKLPFVGFVPVQAPDATHVVAPGADHDSVTLSPNSPFPPDAPRFGAIVAT
jgi:hypothetical protein